MRVIGFCNLKGGVGKTTACQNLAAALVRKGLKVAALDIDPQSNLTAAFGISVSDDQPYVYDFLMGDASFSRLWRTRRVDVAPSSLDLAIAEMQLESQPDGTPAARRPSVRRPRRYDCVLCDSPPHWAFSPGTFWPPPTNSSCPWTANFSARQDCAS